MNFGLKKISSLGLGIVLAILFVAIAEAQTPISPRTPSAGTDTAMTFQPSQPLILNAQEVAKENPNTWGLDASFSDYGFGGGAFLGHTFSPDITGMLSLDFGTAEGSKEFDLLAVNKINRVFVIPVMASLQYRVFRDELSDNLRPYVAAGAGPVVAMTTPYADDFFSAFGSAKAKVVPGGYVGLGANFGTDPKTNFGASLRYFIIPYPGGIQSTTTESLPNLSGLFLTVSYGFNF